MSRRLRVPALAAALVLCCAAVLSAAGATPTGTHKDDTPDLILRYAENQPEGYPTTEAAYPFADLVAQRTDGRVEVRVYSNGVLGSETSVVEQMEYGGIDFSRISIMSLGEFVPQVYVLQLPFLYENDDHMWAVLDGPIGEVAKYMLLDGHTRIPELMLASAEAMDKLAVLDPEYPALVRECAKEAGLLERDLWRQTEAASEEKMRKAGVTVTTLDEEELERFRQATAPIYDMYADQKALIRRILNAAPDGE